MLPKSTAMLIVAITAVCAAVAGAVWFMQREKPMPESIPEYTPEPNVPADKPAESGPHYATFGGGCFWCTEAVFQRLAGVQEVTSGYMGGTVENPTYEAICTGTTGHAEVIRIKYDPALLEYATLLRVFWATHDPTTLNRQGHDVGTQYRSVIFTHTPEQAEVAQHYKAKLETEKIFDDPIVTEITPAVTFYPAEKYHQNYYNTNPNQGYCRAVVGPKVEKLKKLFADKLAK